MESRPEEEVLDKQSPHDSLHCRKANCERLRGRRERFHKACLKQLPDKYNAVLIQYVVKAESGWCYENNTYT